jgi:hypothetical protein
MAETMIKLQRRILGFRETRSQGAYCATCKLSVPMQSHAACDRRLQSMVDRAVASAGFCRCGYASHLPDQTVSNGV